MQKVVLPNGLTVIYTKKPGNSVVVQVMVKVGSSDEAPHERGIAHFLEHILFEGTTKRPTNELISNEIEKIGGDFNAYTTSERTCYYVKVLKKHFPKAVDVLSDIMQNSLFKEEHVAKEKNIVLKEIDMVNDEPRFFQWLLLQSSLFTTHPCRFPTYGDRKVIKGLTREQVVAFFEKHYVPSNMVLSIVGDIPSWKKIVKSSFVMPKGKAARKAARKITPLRRTIVKRKKRDIANTYLVLGFKTVPKKHKDANVLEVINGILGRGQSGKMFIEIRGKRALAYDVGTQHTAENSFGYFAAYATIDTKNEALVRKLILAEIRKLEKVTEKEIREAKTFIEGDYLLMLEDTQKVADEVLFWEQVGSKRKKYLQGIKNVTAADVRRVVKKYFNKHVMVALEKK